MGVPIYFWKYQNQRNDQECPSDDLSNAEWVFYPMLYVQRKHDQDNFPGKKSIETVLLNIS